MAKKKEKSTFSKQEINQSLAAIWVELIQERWLNLDQDQQILWHFILPYSHPPTPAL